MYVTAEKNYTVFHFQNGTDFLVLQTMEDFEETLENIGFFRVRQAT
jgi:DNA-binding LytR/AlgR family response regulator